MPVHSYLYPVKILVAFALLIILCLQSCSKDGDSMEPNPNNPKEEGIDPITQDNMFHIDRLDGATQKGPYSVGTAVTMIELDQNFIPTGRTFTTEIQNFIGQFEFKNLDLSSPFVEFRANGFYYNEVTDKTSDAPLNLSALVDLTDAETVTINVLTTLEKDRVEFLLESGLSFDAAKNQAAKEVLDLFHQESNADINSEDLNITDTGDNNASLLAVSAILQGNLSVGDLAQLISKIKIDISTDGIVDDESVCMQLSTSAYLLDATSVRENLKNWYQENSTTVEIPDFSSHLTIFLDNTTCAISSGIIYPDAGRHGINLLAPGNTNFDLGGPYSLAAELEEGATLRVRIIGYNWSFGIGQTETGWIVSEWQEWGEAFLESGRDFTSSRSGELDFRINLDSRLTGVIDGKVRLEFYENGSTTPTRLKEININGIEPRPSAPRVLAVYADNSSGEKNNIIGRQFLSNSVDSKLFSYEDYGIAVYLPDNFSVEYILSGINFQLPLDKTYGWEIEDLSQGPDKVYKLSASARGYYQQPIEMFHDQGCVVMNVESKVNGDPFGNYLLTTMELPWFNSLLQADQEFGVGPAPLALELWDDSKIEVVISGQGWTLPQNNENLNWEIGQLDSSTNSQKFTADGSKEYEFYLDLEIEPYTAPHDIKVEIYYENDDCASFLLSSHYLKLK